MPLPEPVPERTLLHRRTIEVEGFKRADGLYDIEAKLSDVKTFDLRLADGVRAAGEPVHDMKLRITVDADLTVVDVCAVTDAMPYQGECQKINPNYGQLKGHKIASGFRAFLASRFGGLNGCTHMTELLGALAPATVQALRGQQRVRGHDPDAKPFQLDGCHALATNGPTVAKFYPRWYRGSPEKA
jgi:Protein of unknown function (DUF2889)